MKALLLSTRNTILLVLLMLTLMTGCDKDNTFEVLIEGESEMLFNSNDSSTTFRIFASNNWTIDILDENEPVT